MESGQGDWLGLLRQKGIRPGGFFRLGESYYALRRSGRAFDMFGAPVIFTENDLWEAYDQLQRVSKAQFEAAQAEGMGQRLARHGLTEEKLELLARQFAAAYPDHPEQWQTICQYEEEAIRYILQKVAEREEKPQRARRFEELFRQVVLAKAAAALTRRQ